MEAEKVTLTAEDKQPSGQPDGGKTPKDGTPKEASAGPR